MNPYVRPHGLHVDEIGPSHRVAARSASSAPAQHGHSAWHPIESERDARATKPPTMQRETMAKPIGRNQAADHGSDSMVRLTRRHDSTGSGEFVAIVRDHWSNVLLLAAIAFLIVMRLS